MKTTPDQVTLPAIEANDNSLFSGATLKLLVAQIEKEIRTVVLDPTIKDQYKHFGTINRKISVAKAEIERRGKALVDPIKAQCKEIDEKRKMVKDRLSALSTDFMAPRTSYDAEILAEQQRAAAMIDDLTFGNRKVGEFKSRPSLDDWSARIDYLESIDPAAEGDRADEVAALRATALSQAEQARDLWIEQDAALEAGRAALKIQQDAEAAERHAKRVESEKAAKPATTPEVEPTPSAKPSNNLSGFRSKVNRKIVLQLSEIDGVSMDAAKEIVARIYKGQIDCLNITY